MRPGEVWWADLPQPVGAGPGYRRPVVIIQSDAYNVSRIKTVVVATLGTSRRLAAAPGNVRLPRGTCGSSRDSVINVTQLLTIDKVLLLQPMGNLPGAKLHELDDGLRLVLAP